MGHVFINTDRQIFSWHLCLEIIKSYVHWQIPMTRHFEYWQGSQEVATCLVPRKFSYLLESCIHLLANLSIYVEPAHILLCQQTGKLYGEAWFQGSLPLCAVGFHTVAPHTLSCDCICMAWRKWKERFFSLSFITVELRVIQWHIA